MGPSRFRCLALVANCFILAAPAALAAQSITLAVDATRTQQKLLSAHEVIPVSPGPLTLYYPKWIPGEHGPDGPISSLTGLKFEADGKTIPWKRDLLDVFTFHLDIPAGVNHLDARYDFIEPEGGSATDKLMVLEWNEVILYPAGAPAQQLNYEASLRMPDGWKFGTPLPVQMQTSNQVSFKPISLDLLVDSPVIAGQYYRAIDLTPPGEPIHHEIDMVADSEAALAMSPEIQKAMTNLVAESGKLFGTRTTATTIFSLPSAITWPTSAWNIMNRMTAVCQSEPCLDPVPAWRWAGCWHTNLCTRGTESFDARPTSLWPITRSR